MRLAPRSRAFRLFPARTLQAGLCLLGLGLLTPGCESLEQATSCEAGIAANADALTGSVDALVAVSGQMKADLAVACTALTTDLGGTPAPIANPAAPTDDEVTAACTAASAALRAEISAAGAIQFTVAGGRCSLNAQAQFSCESKCAVNGACDPGTVEARCTPGELSVQCDGVCSAGASCQGSASVKANCQGTCSATCEGQCSGSFRGSCAGSCDGQCDGQAVSGATCAGTCEGTCTGGTATGSCAGECQGTCTGECQLAANTQVTCGAEATCKGSCEGTASAPRCEGKLDPPSCELDANCEAACDGRGKFEAECSPPTIEVQAGGSARLTSTLQANLPKVLAVLSRGRLAVDAATSVASSATTVAADITGSAGCLARYGLDFAADLKAAGAASASVSVSVRASADVSASSSSQP